MTEVIVMSISGRYRSYEENVIVLSLAIIVWVQAVYSRRLDLLHKKEPLNKRRMSGWKADKSQYI